MELRARLASLFDVPVAVATATASTELDPLLPLEAEVVGPRWAPKRLWEFRAGRHCAHHALEQLGIPSGFGIGRDANGCPLWPTGVTGSITHTGRGSDAAAACVVTRALRSIGIDVERAAPLTHELQRHVFTAKELADAERAHPEPDGPGWHALRVFCAKEAFYKCQYPLTGRFLGFQDVETRFDFAEGTFEAWCVSDPGLGVGLLQGRFLQSEEFVLCGVGFGAP